MAGNKKFKLVINSERCKGCGLCLEYCPKGALKVSEKYNSLGIHPMELGDESKCTGCSFCAISCPDAAIEIIEDK